MTTQDGPSFHVWKRGTGNSDEWELALVSNSYVRAEHEVSSARHRGLHFYATEKAGLRDNGRGTVEHVMFVWCQCFNDYARGEPVGRGFGFSKQQERLVHYRIPDDAQPASQPTPRVVRPAREAVRRADALEKRPVRQVIVRPSREVGLTEGEDDAAVEYATKPCDHCGKILPFSELEWHFHEVKVGSISGVRRNSSSTSFRSSPRGGSIVTRRGTSYTSGRTYYGKEGLLLCKSCLKAVKAQDRVSSTIRFFSWLLR